MVSILTDHIRHYGTPAANNSFLAEVRRLLRQRMRRTGLLGWNPALLGYPDVPSWSADGAFDDITQDCYLSAVAARIKGLRRALRPGQDIDPLIIRNIKHFLAERQRGNNPIGYAVYQNVRAAGEAARDEGWLQIQRQPRQPLTTCLLRLDGATGPVVLVDSLSEHVAAQPGAEGIGLTLSRCSLEAQEWIGALLRSLRSKGVGPIRVGDLVAVLERRAQDAWPANAPPPSQTAAEFGEEDETTTVRIIPADESVANRDHYRRLVARAEQQLSQLPQLDHVRARRLRVLAAIVQHADQTEGAPLRQVDLARELGIHQVTLCHDVEAIRQIFSRIANKE